MIRFQSDEIGSKMQFGTAWWFNDNIDGMEAQIKALANLDCPAILHMLMTPAHSFLPQTRVFQKDTLQLYGRSC